MMARWRNEDVQNTMTAYFKLLVFAKRKFEYKMFHLHLSPCISRNLTLHEVHRDRMYDGVQV